MALIESRTVYVSVAQRYWRPDWSAEKNREVYGQDASPEGLGANLKIEATAERVGVEEALLEIKDWIDHRAFFEDFEVFRTQPSTLENITRFLAEKLEGATLRVWQDEALSCEARLSKTTLALAQKVGNLTVTCEGEIDSVSGLIFNRQENRSKILQAAHVVEKLHLADVKSWSESLWRELHNVLPAMTELAIELGRQKYLLHV